MKRRGTVGVGALVLVFGCGCNNAMPSATSNVRAPAETTAAPTVRPTARPVETAKPPRVDGPTGTWTSASCGGRTYAREITLATDKTFVARDLVAPCPPKVACVWSGIVERKGTWTLDGTKLTLTTDPNVKEKTPGSPLERSLSFDAGIVREGDCAYSRR